MVCNNIFNNNYSQTLPLYEASAWIIKNMLVFPILFKRILCQKLDNKGKLIIIFWENKINIFSWFF